jgi:hypothetical protein
MRVERGGGDCESEYTCQSPSSLSVMSSLAFCPGLTCAGSSLAESEAAVAGFCAITLAETVMSAIKAIKSNRIFLKQSADINFNLSE